MNPHLDGSLLLLGLGECLAEPVDGELQGAGLLLQLLDLPHQAVHTVRQHLEESRELLVYLFGKSHLFINYSKNDVIIATKSNHFRTK